MPRSASASKWSPANAGDADAIAATPSVASAVPVLAGVQKLSADASVDVTVVDAVDAPATVIGDRMINDHAEVSIPTVEIGRAHV